uniref:Uncharacterized protein n=1 Tax=Romanomermis culicivorax TaxID=13658 RepID=A0A915L9U2_ROMCU
MKSRSLIVCSFVQCVIGHFKFVLWVLEVVWSRNLGQARRFVFFNYTIDEPIWNLIYVMIGVGGIFAAKNGNRILCYCTLLFTGLSIFPVLQYLWVDYRWLLNVKSSDFLIQVPKPHLLLQMNIFLSCLHLIFIFVTVGVMLDRFVRNRLPWNSSKVSIDGTLKQSVLYTGILMIAAGVILLIMDVTHISNGTFYRMFSPTEHRLPFLLIPSGVVALFITVRNEYIPYALPCCVPLLVACVQSSSFNVATFLYLSHNSYFTEQLCDLFYFVRYKCDKKVESFGVVSHFFEATVSFGCAALCAYLMVIFYRLTNMYRTILQYPLTDDEIMRVKGHSLGAKFFGLFQMVIGVAVFLVSIYGPTQDQYKSILYHPFILIHMLIYRVTLSVPFILNPLIQCFALWSNDLHTKPLKALLAMAVSYVWTLDIFLQLDYRILSSMGVGWSIIVCLELVTLFVQFALAAECAVLMDIGQNRLPQFDFVEYDRDGGGADSPTGTLNFNGDEFNHDSDDDCKSSGTNDLV